jgi:hypothetical protein
MYVCPRQLRQRQVTTISGSMKYELWSKSQFFATALAAIRFVSADLRQSSAPTKTFVSAQWASLYSPRVPTFVIVLAQTIQCSPICLCLPKATLALQLGSSQMSRDHWRPMPVSTCPFFARATIYPKQSPTETTCVRPITSRKSRQRAVAGYISLSLGD